MRWWINLATALALVVALPRWLVGWLRGRYRMADVTARLVGWLAPRSGNKPCLWLHAPSLGEVNVLLSLLPEIEQRWPGAELLVTCSTTSGYEHARHKLAGKRVDWFPAPFSWAARAALARVRPTAIVFIELEMSPTFIDLAHESGVPLYVVNGRISDRQQRLMSAWPSCAATTLQKFTAIFCQSPADAEWFTRFGARPEQLAVTGSLKFDLATADHRDAADRLAELAGIDDDDPVFLAGSTKAGEELAAITAYTEALREHPRLRLVIAPRNASRFAEVGRLLAGRGLAWQRRTELDGAAALSGARVLLVDTVGELAAWWHLADIAFVGGSLFAGGGQNMIEPAACGAAVAFGSHTNNFSDVVSLLLRNEAAVVVENSAALATFVRRCLAEPEFGRLLGWRARQVVQKQSGAVQATLQQLTPRLASLLGESRHSAGRYPASSSRSRAA